MITFFSNPNLINPLDDLVVSPIKFATKLYNLGIRTIVQIFFSSQTNILISKAIECPNQITGELIKSCGYRVPSESAIENLR